MLLFVAVLFYVLLLLFGPCRLSEFILAGPQLSLIKLIKIEFKRNSQYSLCTCGISPEANPTGRITPPHAMLDNKIILCHDQQQHKCK